MEEILRILSFSKDPDNLYREDVILAKEAVGEALKLIDARMDMIEKIDSHPLSWSVATEYQRMKRARTEDTEDAKLFALAEKKVKEQKKIKLDEAKSKTAFRQKVALQSRNAAPRFGNVVVLHLSQVAASVTSRCTCHKSLHLS